MVARVLTPYYRLNQDDVIVSARFCKWRFANNGCYFRGLTQLSTLTPSILMVPAVSTLEFPFAQMHTPLWLVQLPLLRVSC